LAPEGNGQFLENFGIFQETVSVKLNIPDVPSKFKHMPQG
jgi:hypothetical protein